MSRKQICDCCGKDVTRTLFHYTLKGHFAMEDEDLCRECYYRIRDEITGKTKELKVDIVYCGECRHWSEEFHDCGIRDSYGWDYKPTDFCSYGERIEE